MLKHEDNAVARINGNNLQPLAGVSVTVTDKVTGLPASLYADDGITPLVQPLITNDNGYYGFKAPDGTYVLTFSGQRIETFTRELVLDDPQDNPYVTVADLAAGQGASGIGYGDIKLADRLKEEISVLEHGASSTKTNAENKAALQAAISKADTLGGGVVVVPRDIKYGYKSTDKTTWPNFAGCANDILVLDSGPGSTYSAPAKDGMQVRKFFYTAQTASPGQHDGNGEILGAAWAPYYWVDNKADLSGTRAATDNRRASYFTGINGKAVWQWGQGTQDSATATDLQLTNWHLRLYGSSIASPIGDADIMIVDAATGNVWFNTDSNASDGAFVWQTRVPGYYDAIFKSYGTTAYLVLRTSNGATDDAGMRNSGGNLNIWTAGQGDAVTVTKSNRRVKINQSLVTNKVAVTYSAAMTPDAQTGNAFVIAPTNGTAFTINSATNGIDGQEITIRIVNAFGTLGAVTWAPAYRMATWTQPANGFSRSIRFIYEAGNWFEISRTPSDIPN